MHVRATVCGLAAGLAALALVACGSDADSPADESPPAAEQVAAEAAVEDASPSRGGTDQPGQDSVVENMDDMREPPETSGPLSMGADALGDQSTTVPLARGLLDVQPGAAVVWAAYALELGDNDVVEGEAEAGFLYVVSGTVASVIGDVESTLIAQSGAQVGAGVPFSLRAIGGPATIWDIRLRSPMASPPDYASDSPRAWVSRPLQDIPLLPLAVLALVTVPPGGETVVHTHPGPEFIVVTAGRIDYENGFKVAPGITVGATETIGAGVPVQKRNRYMRDGVFLSLFLLDAGQPFASAARFDGGAEADSGEPNLAALANGGRVVAVSSAFAGAAPDATWGANSAIDGDPTTQWSSDGDGDEAWIEIALAQPAAVTRVGFWTRTMGASAEIRSFQIVTDAGEIYGPFALAGPAEVTYFDVDFAAQTLRFEALETSGGNTGAVEIEVYGEPAS